jgi:polyribonucleotide nucleotidyltransferase
MAYQVETELSGRKLSIETGRLAKQADGSALVRYGDTVVLVTAVNDKTPREDIDFLPLTVNYMEKAYAGGKIPGGFFKREGRPTLRETLICRLIDRPIRPLFPKGFNYETQIVGLVLSADTENDPDILGITGASIALSLSPIPFLGPIAGVRVGCVGGELILNPTYEQIKTGSLNLVLAGTEQSVVMMEGAASEVPEELVNQAIFFGHEAIKKIIALQQELIQKASKEKMDFSPPVEEVSSEEMISSHLGRIKEAIAIPDKIKRQESLDAVVEDLLTPHEEDEETQKRIKTAFKDVSKNTLRDRITQEGIRADGRGLKVIRPITIETGLLPRTHGSAVFTRGETQAICIATLGTSQDEQKIDDLEGESYRRFMLHYNFPPFSVGEVRRMMAPGRREIGHGNLAERSILPLLPDKEEFPYAIRVVSEILESNGSSSMATVCGTSLALMDAGVPIKKAIAGIAMGLIFDDDNPVILSDILGLEDHLGDMDFKVAGTDAGITAIQMDIKIGGINKDLINKILDQAREGRLHILGEMNKVLEESRQTMSAYAPRITCIKVKQDKIRDVIGPGGKHVRAIIEETGCKVDIEDDGSIYVASADEAASLRAIEMIHALTEEVEEGKVYTGKVKKIMDFGAFMEIIPGTEGLLHISQLEHYRVKNVTDICKEGDEFPVKVLEIDRSGKIRLSRKALIERN